MKYSKSSAKTFVLGVFYLLLLIGGLFLQSCNPEEEIEDAIDEQIDETITEIENSEEYTDVSESMTSMTSGMGQLFGSESPDSAPGSGRTEEFEECLPELTLDFLAEDGSQAVFTLDFSSIDSSCGGPDVSGSISYELNGDFEITSVEIPDPDGGPGAMIDKDVITSLDIESGSMTFNEFTLEGRTMNGSMDISYGVVDGASQMNLTATDLEVTSNDITVALSSASMTYDWETDVSQEENPLEVDFVLSSTASGSRTADGETKSFTESTVDVEVRTSCFDEDIFLPQSGLSTVTVDGQESIIDYSAGGSSCNLVVTVSTTVNGVEVEEEIDLAD